MDSTIREARLKAEFAHLYPPVQPGVWTPAAEVGARMLFWHLQLTGTVVLGERLLDTQHYEFRGGWSRGDTSDLRTRADDPDAAEPRRQRSA
jgi:hypothetical protein